MPGDTSQKSRSCRGSRQGHFLNVVKKHFVLESLLGPQSSHVNVPYLVGIGLTSASYDYIVVISVSVTVKVPDGETRLTYIDTPRPSI